MWGDSISTVGDSISTAEAIQYCGGIASVLWRNEQLFSKYYEIPSETFYEFSSVETFTYVHSAVGQQLSIEDMGAQVKDLIVWLSFSLIPFSFIFEIQQSVQVILIVSFVSSGVRKGVDNSRLQGTGTLTFFLHSFLNFIRGRSKIYSWLV